MMSTYSNNPPPKPGMTEENVARFQNDLAKADTVRANLLSGLHELRTAKLKSTEREQKLTAARLGEDHPRVVRLKAEVAAGQRINRQLSAEVDRANIPFPVDEHSWTVYGFVRNPELQGQDRLTVALFDHADRWMEAVGYACTDNRGYFQLRYDSGAEKLQEIFIHVSNPKQEVLYRDKKPMKAAAGAVQYREIILGDDCAACPPPPGDTDEPPPAPATVPNVVGTPEETAKARLKTAGFAAKSSTRGVASKQVGQVLEQKPEGGVRAARGSEVAIVVGTAEPRLAVPDVVGQPLRDAKTVLENAGFVAGKIDPANAPVQNKVLKQSPNAGAEAERGAAVDLVVEIPVETAKVPAVEKLPLGEAKKAIAASGLTVGKITPDGAGDEQIVIAQSPKAGTEVERKAAVDLSIEGGKGQVTVPNLKGLRLAEARTALAAVQLTIRHIFPPIIATEIFIVVSHLPIAGMKVERGTPVDVIVAPPPPTTQPPKKSATKKKRPKPRKKKKAQE